MSSNDYISPELEQGAQREALNRAIANREQIQVGTNQENDSVESSIVEANISETKKNSFAVDGNPADELAAIRETILRKQPLKYRNDGSAITSSPDSGDHLSSTSTDNISETKKNCFAAQWYQRNRGLMNAEIDMMLRKYPDAKVSFLKDGRMAWTNTANIKIGDIKHPWVFTLIYDTTHPNNATYGGSVKVYLVSPTIPELQARAAKANRGFIPHLRRDAYNNIFLCTNAADDVSDGRKEISTALTFMNWAISWGYHFEMGLLDQQCWNVFCGY